MGNTASSLTDSVYNATQDLSDNTNNFFNPPKEVTDPTSSKTSDIAWDNFDEVGFQCGLNPATGFSSPSKSISESNIKPLSNQSKSEKSQAKSNIDKIERSVAQLKVTTNGKAQPFVSVPPQSQRDLILKSSKSEAKSNPRQSKTDQSLKPRGDANSVDVGDKIKQYFAKQGVLQVGPPYQQDEPIDFSTIDDPSPEHSVVTDYDYQSTGSEHCEIPEYDSEEEMEKERVKKENQK